MSLFQVTKKQVIENYELRTMTGDIVSFTPSYSQLLPDPFSDLNVTVNVLATGGNGTPDNPNPINGYSSANITRCGKNLATLEQGSLNLSDGAEITSTTRVRTNFIRVEEGQTYIATSQNNGWNPRNGVVYDAEKNYINYGIWPDVNTGLLTIPSGVSYVRFIYSHSNTSENCSPSDFWYQFEKGSTATAYAPYNGQTYAIAFGQTVYGGVLDVTRGKLHVTNSRIDMGALGWLYNSGQHRMYAVLNGSKMPTDVNMLANIVCEIYKTDTFYHVQVNDSDLIIGGLSSGGYSFVTVYDSNYTDSETFRTAVTGKYIVYELATPFDIDLTPVQIRALVGVNNVFADCGETTVTCLI